MKGNALIRADLNIDGDTLNKEEWAKKFNQALFVEEFRINLIASLFKGED